MFQISKSTRKAPAFLIGNGYRLFATDGLKSSRVKDSTETKVISDRGMSFAMSGKKTGRLRTLYDILLSFQ